MGNVAVSYSVLLLVLYLMFFCNGGGESVVVVTVDCGKSIVNNAGVGVSGCHKCLL